MPVDVTAPIGRALQRKESWSPSLASVVAWTFSITGGIAVDWDGDAGEAWIRLLSGSDPVAYLTVTTPLLFAPGLAVTWPYPLEVIELSSVADDVMACSSEVLVAISEQLRGRSGFDPGRFTAEDLWYATV